MYSYFISGKKVFSTFSQTPKTIKQHCHDSIPKGKRKKAINNLIAELDDKKDSLNDDVRNALNFLLPQIKDEQKLRMINDIILDLERVWRCGKLDSNEKIDYDRIEKEIDWFKEIGNGLIKKILNEI